MTDVVMPQMGESIVEGTLTKWLKKAGDTVERDEPLFEISTDKVDTEIPAPASGVLTEVLVQEGETVGVNAIVARISEAGSVAAAPVAPPVVVAAAPPAPVVAAPAPVAPAPVEEVSAGPVGPLSPLVRKMARENNIDLSKVTGTGAGGRIVREDVDAYMRTQAVPVAAVVAAVVAAPAPVAAPVAAALPFPVKGEAIEALAIAGEVWLTGGDVNAAEDSTVILDVKGTAEKSGTAYSFEGSLTIGANRLGPVSDRSQPGAHPICKERIVSPIPLSLDVRSGGSLLVRVDPRGLFKNVEFSELDQAPDSPKLYRFKDTTDGQPNVNIYGALESREGTYELVWNSSPK